MGIAKTKISKSLIHVIEKRFNRDFYYTKAMVIEDIVKNNLGFPIERGSLRQYQTTCLHYMENNGFSFLNDVECRNKIKEFARKSFYASVEISQKEIFGKKIITNIGDFEKAIEIKFDAIKNRFQSKYHRSYFLEVKRLIRDSNEFLTDQVQKKVFRNHVLVELSKIYENYEDAFSEIHLNPIIKGSDHLQSIFSERTVKPDFRRIKSGISDVQIYKTDTTDFDISKYSKDERKIILGMQDIIKNREDGLYTKSEVIKELNEFYSKNKLEDVDSDNVIKAYIITAFRLLNLNWEKDMAIILKGTIS